MLRPWQRPVPIQWVRPCGSRGYCAGRYSGAGFASLQAWTIGADILRSCKHGTERRALALRGKPQELAVRVICDDVDQAVGPLPHVAEAAATIAKKFFFRYDAVVPDLEANDLHARQTADEDVVFPARQLVARVEN